ncbi:hypothetical protein CONLIGDRAFT_644750 [Coniochaeta ligniaria NRRL 30616]|uniref:Uncharacterized protein n=1 Tax=Coniochaeta ligniaria NRRL 30616 TaxID=1408157 RepID=A0A1J7ILX2_9PEZI|nr:hypothetical protein CONLIGDRAFT_644750 [Coniochaeta ligniaria NRRL 30616]
MVDSVNHGTLYYWAPSAHLSRTVRTIKAQGLQGSHNASGESNGQPATCVTMSRLIPFPAERFLGKHTSQPGQDRHVAEVSFSTWVGIHPLWQLTPPTPDAHPHSEQFAMPVPGVGNIRRAKQMVKGRPHGPFGWLLTDSIVRILVSSARHKLQVNQSAPAASWNLEALRQSSNAWVHTSDYQSHS